MYMYMYLVYWPQSVPPVVILSDEPLVVLDVKTGCISEAPFPSLSKFFDLALSESL